MAVPTEDVFYKTVDENGRPVILRVTLPQIDAISAVARFPHEWAKTVDGHTAAPPAPGPDDLSDAVGVSGGNPMLVGGIGVKEIIRLQVEEALKKKGSPATA